MFTKKMKLKFFDKDMMNSGGETDLTTLLAKLSPKFIGGFYCFITIDKQTHLDPSSLSSLYDSALMTFKEDEGLCMLLPEDLAKSNSFSYNGVFRGITLDVHSSLDAVGLTAAVSTKLAENNISANIVAATFHDHIFVPKDDAETALLLLRDM